MAFNLKKVLKALLLSTNQPLGIKDIQAVFTRFHDQAAELAETDEEGAAAPAPVAESVAPEAAVADTAAPEASAEVSAEVTAETAAEDLAGRPAEPAAVPETASPEPAASAVPGSAAEPTEIRIDEGAQDPELYRDVPSLVTGTQIREAMDQIAAELKAADDGLLLIEGNNGYRIVTHPRFGRWLRILRQEPPPVKLSQSAIETLAVIAYRQPVTRGEIETIRGVSAEAGINKLLERELVYVVGRADSPGRPIQYGTTDQFLEFVGIKSLEELPASDVLSSRQIDEWLKTSENTHAPTDADVGLPEEQLPLDPAAGEAAAEPAPAEESSNGDTPAPTEGAPQS